MVSATEYLLGTDTIPSAAQAAPPASSSDVNARAVKVLVILSSWNWLK
jgi:hypothetical protein